MFGLPDYEIDESSCLTVNVWTPGTDEAARAVLVWIHGGGFSWGSGGDPVYDGARLSARHDVVVVTFNYRLGALGFLQLPGAPGSGCLGLLDQLEALRWVRENIAFFGGDPHRVTLFGQSAGAVSIAAHLAIPDSRGLFHRAILQSGSAEMLLGADEADERATEFAALLDTTPDDLTGLRTLPLEKLLEAQAEFDQRLEARGIIAAFLPVIDGVVLTEQPLAAIESGNAAEVPLIIGGTRDEGRLFTELIPAAMPDESAMLAVFGAAFADPQTAIAGYREQEEWTDTRSLIAAVLGDELFRAPTDRLAQAAVKRGIQVWRYELAYCSRATDHQLGACHSLDLPFVFDLLDTPAGRQFAGEGAPQEIADLVGTAWASFAAGEEPGWPQFADDQRLTLVLDERSVVTADPFATRRAIWERTGLGVGHTAGRAD